MHDERDHGPRGHADDPSAGLRRALGLIAAFMVVEIVAGVLASSLALLSDAAHMLTDVAALGISLLAARLASRPAGGAMTYGLGRAEILSAQANGLTMLVLALLIVYGAIAHLVSPPAVQGGVVLAVALAGMAVNLLAMRALGGHTHGHGHEPAQPDVETGGGELRRPPPTRSLNVEGSARHIATDLFGFVATAVAAAVILLTGFRRADAIASLLIAGVMLVAARGLLGASLRVMMEAAPEGLDPEGIGRAMAEQPGVTEVHDLHVWEVTTGFPSVSAHVVVDAGRDCHEVRRALTRLLEERFDLAHSTLQVEHARADQAPLQIELSAAPRPGASA